MTKRYKKVAFKSDLHLDHWYQTRDPEVLRIAAKMEFQRMEVQVEADLYVIAGDMHDGYSTEIHYSAKDKTLFVPGNHDFYRKQFGSPIVNDGDLFAATFWTNFSGARYRAEQVFDNIMDRERITYAPGVNVTWRDLTRAQEEAASLLFSREELPPIVATHFPLFRRHVADEFRWSPLNEYFQNDLERDVDDAVTRRAWKGSSLWICGHTHSPHSYDLNYGECHILVGCNPLGYPSEAVKRGITSLEQYQPAVAEINTEGKWVLST